MQYNFLVPNAIQKREDILKLLVLHNWHCDYNSLGYTSAAIQLKVNVQAVHPTSLV